VLAVKNVPALDGERFGRTLSRALSNTNIIVLYQDLDLKVVWAQNVPPLWSSEPLEGCRDEDFLPSVAGELSARKRAVLASGERQNFELGLGQGAGGRFYQVWLDVDRDELGAAQGIISTVVDITAQKHREQTLRTLLREVSHRSKNLLTIILSIATQTGRYSGTIDTFLDRFRGRVQSLAASQDLVTSSNWRGATLHELVQHQMERYCDDLERSVRLRGIDPYLNPNASLHIGLALHELVVNSISHGALSTPSGHVDLTATLDENEGQAEMLLEWREIISDTAPERERRFGTVALERVVPLSVEGKAELTIMGDELVYRLTVPATNFEIEH
jgi:two-component sensor histidine kinase